MIRQTTARHAGAQGGSMTLVEVETTPGTADAGATPPERTGAAATREVRHEYTRTLPPLLSQLGVSLLVSTYQAGKVVAVGVAQGELTLSYHNFERAMGLAVKPDRVAVGARAQVWFLKSAADLAARVEPAGRHDACYLTRSSHFTGEIQAHELAWGRDDLWLVNTAFVGLCKIRETSTFGGMPIAARRAELKCGVGVVDLGTGGLAAHLEFVTGVEEIFDVQVLPGARCPVLSGPHPSLDGAAPIWTVPEAARASQGS